MQQRVGVTGLHGPQLQTLGLEVPRHDRGILA
jgi:hypothetical protein